MVNGIEKHENKDKCYKFMEFLNSRDNHRFCKKMKVEKNKHSIENHRKL